MKKLMILLVMAAMVNFAIVGVSKAADPNMPKFDPNAIRGKVAVVKDASGAITSIKIENKRRGDWNVVLDEKGKELAQMDGKYVHVTGKEETKDGQKWVTVESYKELKRPEGRRGYGDPNQMRRHHPGAPGNEQK
jgi:hypothetical protein